ncbi:MAG: LysR family transcriptional regulator [Propionibacteriaceae bacterium]
MRPKHSTMTMVQLEALLAVMRHGSASAAAKELGYTTSAISQQLMNLEKTMGVQLFERGPRSMQVTPAGEEMAGHAADILGEIALAGDRMQAFAEAESGRLRIAAAGSAAAQLLPRAVSRLTARHPRADITMVLPGERMGVRQAVENGTADVGIEYAHAADDPTGSVVAAELFSEEFVVLGRDQGESGMRADLAHFADCVWIAPPAGSDQDALFERAARAYGFTPQVRFRSEDVDVTRGLIREGLGVAMLPVMALGIDRRIRLYRLHEVPGRRRVLLLARPHDRNPLLHSVHAALHEAAEDFLRWSLDAFQITFDTPMLSVSELPPSTNR